MRFVLFILMLFCVCMPAFGANTAKIPDTHHKGLRTTFETSDSGKTVVIGSTFSAAIISFELDNNFNGNLYACAAKLFVSDTCDLITALIADMTTLENHTTRAFYIVVVTTGDASVLTIKGTHDAFFRLGGGPFTLAYYSAGTLNSPTTVIAGSNQWRQLDPGITVDTTVGTGLTISVDDKLWCNVTGNTLRGQLQVRTFIAQGFDNVQTLRMRFGTRTGQGALIDGDEMVGPEDRGIFKDALESRPNMGLTTSGDWPTGECRGLMVRRLDGLNRSYRILIGSYAALFGEVP